MSDVAKEYRREVPLSSDMIDLEIAKAHNSHEAIIALYRVAFDPEWDNIKNLDGHPTVSRITATYILGKMRGKFGNDSLMLWLNRGFSAKDGIPDWIIFNSGVTVNMNNGTEIKFKEM